LDEVCKDVRIEPALQPLSGENFERPTNTNDEARCDVSARNFWQRGQVAFLDVRVFNPTAARYSKLEVERCYEINEREKKRQYNDRIMEVDHGSFTPIVISANGGMGREATKFYTRLSQMIADKRKQNYSLIKSWIRRKICFSLIKSIILCIRGSRNVFNDAAISRSMNNDAAISEFTSDIK